MTHFLHFYFLFSSLHSFKKVIQVLLVHYHPPLTITSVFTKGNSHKNNGLKSREECLKKQNLIMLVLSTLKQQKRQFSKMLLVEQVKDQI